jgi:HEAT repeat protein
MGIFGKFKPKSKVQKLIDDLYTKNMDARKKAVLELASMGESAVEPLINDLKTVKSIPIQGGSPDALATIGEPAIEPLVRILYDSESTGMARFGAIMALTKMTDGASWSLNRVLMDKAVEPLIEAISRSDCKGFMFANICIALGRIGDPRALEPMKRAFEASKDEAWINNVVKEAIEKIQKK